MLVSRYIFLLFLAITVNSDQRHAVKRVDEGNGGEKAYDVVDESLAEVATSNNVWLEPTAWGAFTFGLVSSAGELMNVCNWCWEHHRNPDGNCAINLRGLATSLGIGVAGLTAGIGTTAKRDLLTNEDILENAFRHWNNSHYGVLDYFANNEIQTLSSGLRNVGYLRIADGNKVVAHNHIYLGEGVTTLQLEAVSDTNNTESTKRDNPGTGYPMCKGSMVIDYCHNEGEFVYGQSAIEYDMGRLAKHFIPDDVEYGVAYKGYTADYYKIYLDNSDWLMSWRWYYAEPDANIYWSRCDTGL